MPPKKDVNEIMRKARAAKDAKRLELEAELNQPQSLSQEAVIAPSDEDLKYINAYLRHPSNPHDPRRALSILWETDPQPSPSIMMMSNKQRCKETHPDFDDELKSGTSDVIGYAILDALNPLRGDGSSVYHEKRRLRKFEPTDEDFMTDDDAGVAGAAADAAADDSADHASANIEKPEKSKDNAGAADTGAEITEDDTPADAKRKNKKMIKSTKYVDPADDETDEERDREFFALEEEIRRMASKKAEDVAVAKSKVREEGKKGCNAGADETATNSQKSTTNDDKCKKRSLVILAVVKFPSKAEHETFVRKYSEKTLNDKIWYACLGNKPAVESTYDINIKQYFIYHDKLDEAAAVFERAGIPSKPGARKRRLDLILSIESSDNERHEEI